MTTPHSAAVEVEVQFDAPDLEAVRDWLVTQPVHSTLTFVPEPERHQRDEYLDTPDWRVYRARFTLRIRRLPTAAEATMKAFGDARDGLRRRLEVNQTLPLAPPEAPPAPAPEGATLEAATAPEAPAAPLDLLATEGPVAGRLRLLLGPHPLRSLFVIETRRRPFAIQRAGVTLAVLTLDEATVNADAAAPPLRRVEVEEAFPGAMDQIAPFIHALRAATALQPATSSKFEAGLAAAGLTPEAVPDLGSVALDPDASAPDFAYAVLRRYYADLLRHEPGTRLGEDIEELHQMRVATRRLRAAMSAFEPVLPDALHTLRDELRWVAAALGSVRDLDVQLEALEAIQRDAGWDEGTAVGPLIQLVQDARAEAREQMLAALNSPAYDSLLARMTEALRSGPPAAEGSPAPSARSFARVLVQQRYRRFRRDADRLTPRSEPAAFHAVRIRGKRLRYSVEFTGRLFGRPAVRLDRSLRGVQDLLGDHQDADVARDWLHRTAREHGRDLPPDTLFLMGQLAERHGVRMATLRRDWPDHFDEVKDRWSRLRRVLDDSDPRSPTPADAPPTVARRLARPAARPRTTRYRLLRLPGLPHRPDPD